MLSKVTRIAFILLFLVILAGIVPTSLGQEPATPPSQPQPGSPAVVMTAEPAPADSPVIVVEQPAAPPAIDPTVQWVTTLITGALAVGGILFGYFNKTQGAGSTDAVKELLAEVKESRQLLYEAIPPNVFNFVGGIAKEATGILGTAYTLTKEVEQIFTPPNEGQQSLTITPPAGATELEVNVKSDLPPQPQP